MSAAKFGEESKREGMAGTYPPTSQTENATDAAHGH